MLVLMIIGNSELKYCSIGTVFSKDFSLPKKFLASVNQQMSSP
jgi:hypothetical protein